MNFRFLFAFLAGLLLAACDSEPDRPAGPPSPALWTIGDESGVRGWLFGTIHTLPDGTTWRTATLGRAFEASGTLVVEIADLDDREMLEQAFAKLARTPGLPPLTARVSPENRPLLSRQLERAGMDPSDFTQIETWAAALMLSRMANADDARNGVDLALIADARGKPVRELEGAERQLGLFDGLDERDQRDLLDAVVGTAARASEQRRTLASAWRAGDMETIAREAQRGLLDDPELHETLLAGRNRDWAARIDEMLRAGERPFVAVGAAHLAGEVGLPALLERRGWKLARIQ